MTLRKVIGNNNEHSNGANKYVKKQLIIFVTEVIRKESEHTQGASLLSKEASVLHDHISEGRTEV